MDRVRRVQCRLMPSSLLETKGFSIFFCGGGGAGGAMGDAVARGGPGGPGSGSLVGLGFGPFWRAIHVSDVVWLRPKKLK